MIVMCCMSVSAVLCCVDVLPRGCIKMFAIVFSVVNVNSHHLKLCVVCINGQRCVCYSECNVVSNECDEPTPCTVVKVCTLGVFPLGMSLVS